MSDFWIYLVILAGSTYLIRAIPFALISRSIKNRFVRSFLHYIPYAVLSAMILPASFYATGTIASGVAGLIVGFFFAYRGKGLTFVAIASCIGSFLVELLLYIL